MDTFKSIQAHICGHVLRDLGAEYFDVVDRVKAATNFEELSRVLEEEEMSPTYALSGATDEQLEWWDNQL